MSTLAPLSACTSARKRPTVHRYLGKPPRPVWRLLFFALVGCAFLLNSSLDAQANVRVTGTKTRTANSMTLSDAMVIVSVGLSFTPGPGQPVPPAVTPTFDLDLYDSDLVVDDAKGGPPWDLTNASPGVTVAGGGWTKGSTYGNPLKPGSGIQVWNYKWNLPTITVNATDVFSSPDPFVDVYTTGPMAGKTTIDAPNLPSVGMADVGVTGPLNLATSTVLFGHPIAAFSRGWDEISALSTTASPEPAPASAAALYFSTDAATTVGAPGIALGPGTVYVHDAAGDGWEEEAFGVGIPSQTIEFFNVNSGMPLGGVPATDMYLVAENSSTIEYAATGDPSSTSTFLSLSTGGIAVTALAVEDLGVRGTWDAGDSILYALENSSVINKLTFGGVAAPLTANGVTFDGTGAISFDHLEPSVYSGVTMTPGYITSLSVASGLDLMMMPAADWIPTDFNLTAIPEPSTLLLSIAFVGGTTLGRKRRSHRHRS